MFESQAKYPVHQYKISPFEISNKHKIGFTKVNLPLPERPTKSTFWVDNLSIL